MVDAKGFSAAATRSEPLTGKGTLLGTLQYMAPEQLEGKEVDARTDMFAFGALVYETVTGKKAFGGDSQASLIHSIIGVDPPVMSSLRAVSPSPLDRVVKKCLAKDPDGRWQSASDLTDELRWIVESASERMDAIAGVGTPQESSRRQGMTLALAALVLVVGSVITGVAVWRVTRSESPPGRSLARFAVTTPLDGKFRTVSILPEVAMSPDGTHIVWGSGGGGLTSPQSSALLCKQS